MADTLDCAWRRYWPIRRTHAKNGDMLRPRWPMICSAARRAGRARLMWTDSRWRTTGAPIRCPYSPTRPSISRQIRAVAALLQAGGAVRRERRAGAGAAGLPAEGHAPHGREPARKRRTAAEGPENAGLPRLRRGYPVPRQRRGAGYGRAWHLRARYIQAQ